MNIEAYEFLRVMSREEFAEKYTELNTEPTIKRAMGQGRFCKAEMLSPLGGLPVCAAGTLALPERESLCRPGQAVAFYLDREKLLLVDDGNTARDVISAMEEGHIKDPKAPMFFFELLETVIRQDTAFLQKQESHLDSLEGRVLESDVKDFDNRLHTCRRVLLRMSTYYGQMGELGEALSTNLNGLMTEEQARAFQLFADRAARLEAHTRSLREYSLQLHEIYQSKLDAKQNKVMQFLTVVTTIFMPLTLIAGWYGMNFTHMPELKFPLAYPVIILISAVITLAEIIYFKKKKWF